MANNIDVELLVIDQSFGVDVEPTAVAAAIGYVDHQAFLSPMKTLVMDGAEEFPEEKNIAQYQCEIGSLAIPFLFTQEVLYYLAIEPDSNTVDEKMVVAVAGVHSLGGSA